MLSDYTILCTRSSEEQDYPHPSQWLTGLGFFAVLLAHALITHV
jgi:hypothetical protein